MRRLNRRRFLGLLGAGATGLAGPRLSWGAWNKKPNIVLVFAEAAGADIADLVIDGISLMPVLKQTAPLDRDTLYWHYPHYHTGGSGPSGAIREGNYKLIEWFEKSIDGIDAPGAIELFDLARDAGERYDLAPALPDTAKRLHEKLRTWRKSVNAQEMKVNPNHDPGQLPESPAVVQGLSF